MSRFKLLQKSGLGLVVLMIVIIILIFTAERKNLGHDESINEKSELNNITKNIDYVKSVVNKLSDEERAWLREHPVIRVTQDPAWPPVEFADESGNPSGISNDYLEIIEKRLEIKFEKVIRHSWQEALEELKRKDIDMTLSVAVTPERTLYWNFTKPYMNIPIVILAQQDVTYISEMNELNGKKLAVVDGYAVVEWITRDFPEIQLVKVADTGSGIDLLQKGEVFALADNMLVTGYYLTKLKSANLKIAGTTPYNNAQCMAVRKDWPVLTGIIQKALDSISETERNAIYSKWVPIRYEHGFDYTFFWQITAVFLLILTAFIFWIQKLLVEIRQRKKVERALRKSENHLYTLVQTIPDLVWLKDNDGVYLSCNAMFERFFGAEIKDILGKTDYDFMEKEHADFFRDKDREAVKAGKPVSNEEWITFADDGHKALLDTIKTPMYDNDGNLLGVLGIGRDITDRKNAEDHIACLLREKELLLQEVHQRIKNNMNTIKGLLSLQLIAEEGSSAAPSLRDAESRVQSMIMLYDRLYCTENFRELSVKDYLQTLTEEIIGSFSERSKVKIKTEIEDFILNINKLTPLGIIINELLTNMMKYAFIGKESGTITVSASMNDSHVVVKVQDDGVGIPESVSFQNTKGFGLELVGMLTEQMNGSIRIERNQGTKFILEFEI